MAFKDKIDSLSSLTLRGIYDRKLLAASFFHIFEKLKNGGYDLTSAMATAKNVGGRCRPRRSSRTLSQKICLGLVEKE